MTDLPQPPVPADCDLRDFAFMPLDVVRLRDSGLAASATGDEFRAAVLLWCASWHQVPAASLPDDDGQLAHLAGYGRSLRGWQKVRPGAMRGWQKHSDGRLYHSLVSEKAATSWASKLAQRQRTEAARAAREVSRNGHARSVTTSVTGPVTDTVTGSKGQGQGQGQGQIDIPTPSSSSVVPPREDYSATATTTLPASPSLDIPTAAHRFRAANAVKIAKAAKARDLPGLLAAFGANAKYPEWAAVTDGLNVATIVAVLGLAVAHGGVIRAPSGFIKGKRAWDAMSKDERAEAGRAQCLLYGIEIPPTNKETT